MVLLSDLLGLAQAWGQPLVVGSPRSWGFPSLCLIRVACTAEGGIICRPEMASPGCGSLC